MSENRSIVTSIGMKLLLLFCSEICTDTMHQLRPYGVVFLKANKNCVHISPEYTFYTSKFAGNGPFQPLKHFARTNPMSQNKVSDQRLHVTSIDEVWLVQILLSIELFVWSAYYSKPMWHAGVLWSNIHSVKLRLDKSTCTPESVTSVPLHSLWEQ